MHYQVIVVTDNGTDDEVWRAMQPFSAHSADCRNDDHYCGVNASSKWDWYEIGGRWTDAVFYSDATRKFDDDINGLMAWAFVDADGVWHETDEEITRPFDGMSRDDGWKEQLKALVSAVPIGKMLTVVDIHI